MARKFVDIRMNVSITLEYSTLEYNDLLKFVVASIVVSALIAFCSVYLLKLVVAVVISSLIAFRSYRNKSLHRSGAIVGFFVMFVHIAASYRFGAMLLVYYFTSSMLAKIGEERKRSIVDHFMEADQRTWKKVLSNSGISTILVSVFWKFSGWEDRCLDSNESSLLTSLIGGVIGYYCCSIGDTWSSELGVLSEEQPRLITTFKPVWRGTNGGVTRNGLLAAVAGGSVIGLSFVIPGFFTTKCTSNVAFKQLLVIPLSALAGLTGSLIDSLLGATLQFSGFCSIRKKIVSEPGPTVKKISGLSILDNDGVNFVSILLTTIFTLIACKYIF